MYYPQVDLWMEQGIILQVIPVSIQFYAIRNQ